MAVVSINGRICGEHDAVVSVFDHGFLFGDGVYEVLRTYDGELFEAGPHFERLRTSAAMIALPVPFSDDDLLARVREAMAAFGGDGERYVRILLTRGEGEFTYDPHACPHPTLVIIVKALPPDVPQHYAQGVKVVAVSVMRNHPSSLNPRIKSNNLLNNVLAMQESLRRGGFEALMRNHRGEFVECSQSNVFVVREGGVATPPLDAGLLPGITRAFVIRLARGIGIDVAERPLLDADLLAADEAFLTSTTKGIVPITTIDDRKVGDGMPGTVTRRLMQAFETRVKAHAGAGSR